MGRGRCSLQLYCPLDGKVDEWTAWAGIYCLPMLSAAIEGRFDVPFDFAFVDPSGKNAKRG
jgi:hypothetical protein